MMTDTTRKLLHQFLKDASGQETALLPGAIPELRLSMYFSLYRGDAWRLFEQAIDDWKAYPHQN